MVIYMEEVKTEQNEKRMPIVETRINKSKDGKYIIHKTIITDIKPYGYYKTMMERPVIEEENI